MKVKTAIKLRIFYEYTILKPSQMTYASCMAYETILPDSHSTALTVNTEVP